MSELIRLKEVGFEVVERDPIIKLKEVGLEVVKKHKNRKQK